MTQAKGRRRIEKGVVAMDGQPEVAPQPWELPSKDDWELVDESTIDFVKGDRLRQLIWTYRGQLIDFVLIQETCLGDIDEDADWVEVVRVDCKHLEVHIHRFDSGQNQFRRKVIQPITCQEDISVGFDLAIDMVYDHWEENLRRWERGQ